MHSLFLAGQVFIAIMLIAMILLQPGADGGKGVLGGGGGGETYHTRKGVEKFLYYLTIVFVVLFVLSSIGLLLS